MSDTTVREPEAAVIERLATRAAGATEIEKLGVPRVFVVPEGASLEIADVDHFLAYEKTPRRTTGTYSAHDVESLIDYVAVHEDEAATTLWIDVEKFEITAVLNDHARDSDADAADGARWGDHRIRLALRKSPEWLTWERLDGKLIDQAEFAQHLEQNLFDIDTPSTGDPAPADLLEVASTLHAKTDVVFKSGVKLDSGEVKFQYEEQQTAGAGAQGELPIPREFWISIPPFFGEDPVLLKARLRWRAGAGGLRLGYQLERPHLVLDEAMHRINARLSDERNGFKRVYLGAPANSRNATPNGR